MTTQRILAIYGNYLSDLDQTTTLKNLGATLLKTSHTNPSYRLFSSADQQAVLSEDNSDGRQIRVELWEMNADTVLKLLDSSPSNHHLTKLNLSDGSIALVIVSPLSYCLEQNYEEVSRFGGWERYLLKKAEKES